MKKSNQLKALEAIHTTLSRDQEIRFLPLLRMGEIARQLNEESKRD